MVFKRCLCKFPLLRHIYSLRIIVENFYRGKYLEKKCSNCLGICEYYDNRRSCITKIVDHGL